MSNERITGTPIGNLLYTVEADDSRGKTEAELKTPDPTAERALGVLKDEKNHEPTTNQEIRGETN